MNSVLNINVRIIAGQATAQVKQIEDAIKGLGRTVSNTNSAAGAGGLFGGKGFSALNNAADGLLKFGKNVQWTGRQLEYSFTLPIVAAGAASTKWAFDNERALTSVRKVYGDFSMSQDQVNSDVNKLAKSFELLSDRYGINQREVIQVGAAWAQAGASGVGLARSVEATLKAMVVGELNATDATNGLIAIQSAYQLSSTQLADVMADLNAVENQTAISTGGLIDVITRAGGTAKTAGVSVQQLAAYAAALVPAAGSAAQAGNALRTMISRIMAPTSDAADLMRSMGIEVNSAAWQSQNAVGRINTLATHFMDLSDAQKTVVSASIASRWQINRFDLLMEQVDSNIKNGTKGIGYYTTALNSMSDHTKAQATYQRELNTYLGSNPQQWAMLTNILKNTLSSAVQPLLPSLIILLKRVTELAIAFNNMSPEAKQLVLIMLALLAALGPIARYVGAVAELLAIVGKMALFTGKTFQFLLGIGLKVFAGLVNGVISLASSFLLPNKALAGIGMTSAEVAAEVDAAMASQAAAAEASAAATAASWEAAAAVMQFAVDAAAANVSTALVFVGRNATTMAYISAQAAALTVGSWQRATIAIGAGQTMLALEASTVWEAAVTEIVSTNGVWIASNATVTRLFIAGMTEIVAAWEVTMATITASTSQELVLFQGYQVARVRAEMMADAAIFELRAATTRNMLALEAGATAGRVGAIETTARVTETQVVKQASAWSKLGRFIDVIFLGLPGLLWNALRGLGAMFIRLLAPLATYAAEAGAAIAAAFTWEIWVIVAIVAVVLIAIAALLHKFYDGGIKGFVVDVAHALAQLPRIMQQALAATVRAMLAPIRAIIDLLSYLNPFQRHSPSLVDNVTNGVAVILSQYSKLKNIGPMLTSALRALDNFKGATAGASNAMQTAALNKLRGDVVSAAPSAGPQFDALVGSLATLRPQLAAIQSQIDAQQGVVDKWKTSLDAANAELDHQNDILKGLKDTQDAYKAQLDAAAEALDNLTGNTQIAGLGAMEDAIFANEIAQKKLRLEIDKLQDDPTFKDAANQASKLQGEIEKLQGEAKGLRLGGAGSDVLGPINDQIKAMEDAQANLANGPSGGMDDLQKQLADLQRQGDELDLQKSLQFDPLQRQIDKVTSSMQEMPFDELYKKIVDQQNVVKGLTQQWNDASAAVTAQQAAVDQAQAARDDVQKSYDAENTSLQKLQDAYDAVSKAIQDGESALNDFANAAKSAKDKQDELSQNQQQFNAGAGFDFPDVGGSGGIGPEPGDLDQFNKDLQKQIDDALKGMGKMDLFKPIKDKWNELKKWLSDNVTLDNFKNGLSVIWKAIKTDFDNWIVNPLKSAWNGLWGAIKGAADEAWKWVKDNVFTPIGDFITNNVTPVWQGFRDAVTGAWDDIKKKADEAWTWLRDNVFQPIWDFINNYLVPIWQMFQAVVYLAWWAIQQAADAVWTWLRDNVFNPIMDWIDNKVRPAWKRFKDDISGAWDGIKSAADTAWNWIRDNIFKPIGDWIDNTVRPAWNRLKEDASSAWNGIKGAAETSWNWVRDNVMKPIGDWIDNTALPAWNRFESGVKGVWDNIKSHISGAWTDIQSSFKTGINWLIDHFNDIADKINSVGDKVPGTPHIDHMPRLEAGGVMGARLLAAGGVVPIVPNWGGEFADIRAIVGEGSNNYPEFVIPTDPKYRQNAVSLLKQANMRLLAAGGVVAAGGTSSRMPLSNSDRGGNRELHFHGDLVFPNITDGDDAEDFITNLEKLAG